MKPRTKEEIKIVNFKYKEINFKPSRIFKSIGYKTKTKISCLVCGKDFEQGNDCPHCNSKLKVIETRKMVFEEGKYIEIIESIDDYQIIRHFYATQYAKKGQERKLVISEVIRWVINPKNKVYLLAKATAYAFYNYYWVLDSEFEIRTINYSKYSIYPDIVYKKPKFAERFKYCQYSEKYGVSAIDYFKLYIKHPEIEMLAKTNNGYLIHAMDMNKINIDAYRKEIITVIKNKYKIPDIQVWKDYVDNLKYFGKDTTNPKYVCPADLQKEHKKLIDKKDKLIYEQDNLEYIKRISRYKNLSIESNEIKISVIQDLFQMKHEGNLLGHCVFKNEYFKKKDSLILSARINDQVVETIEIDLVSKKLLQARGKSNKPSDYHDDIVNLVNKNIKKIIKFKEENQIEYCNFNGQTYETARA